MPKGKKGKSGNAGKSRSGGATGSKRATKSRKMRVGAKASAARTVQATGKAAAPPATKAAAPRVRLRGPSPLTYDAGLEPLIKKSSELSERVNELVQDEIG